MLFDSDPPQETLRKPRKSPTRPLSPCVDQTSADKEAYYRYAPLHSPAAVRHTSGGVLHYLVTQIERRTPLSGRVYLRDGGVFFMRSCAKCFEPTGRTRLVLPTEAVVAWASANPSGKLGVAINRDTAL